MVKRQTFFVGDRLKMDKYKGWNNNSIVAPKYVGSMTTKGQMKAVPGRTPGENTQSTVPEHRIVSSIHNVIHRELN